MEVDLIVEYWNSLQSLESRNQRIQLEHWGVQRCHSPSRTWKSTLTSLYRLWGTVCVCLPDSLGIEAGHGPHQGAAPVVTHQGDLWYGLEQGTISFCVNFKLSCYSMTVLILTILSKNTTNS